jgi:DNA-directed RNA polymerase, alpha subunit, bacterial and chloroplast-type
VEGFSEAETACARTGIMTEKYARFSAQPFERGWGTTVGNTLRRALLSSIEGAAITAVKIEGVLHEFSSIAGVVEDATDIILNLKQVPIKLNTDLPKTIYVTVEQPGPVTSAQIEEDADFAVLDKSVYIATVSEGGKLQIEMRVKNGRGYVAADRNYDEDLPIGYIPVDSVHSPVRKVNYSVESARLGQMTDYEKLMLEVWTNGAITPNDAIGLAAKLVKDHMSIFINFEEPTDVRSSGGNDQRSAPRTSRPLRRRARAFRPLLQLPQEREHSDHSRTGAEERKRNAQDQELRPQITQRNQRYTGEDGPRARHEV